MKAISIKTTLASLILAGLSSNAFAYDAQINVSVKPLPPVILIPGSLG